MSQVSGEHLEYTNLCGGRGFAFGHKLFQAHIALHYSISQPRSPPALSLHLSLHPSQSTCGGMSLLTFPLWGGREQEGRKAEASLIHREGDNGLKSASSCLLVATFPMTVSSPEGMDERSTSPHNAAIPSSPSHVDAQGGLQTSHWPHPSQPLLCYHKGNVTNSMKVPPLLPTQCLGPWLRGFQRSGAPKKFFIQLRKHCSRLCAWQHQCKSFNHVWAGKPKGMASLKTALDPKESRDNRIPSAPPLHLSTCRAQPATINCLCGHQPDGEPKRCPGPGVCSPPSSSTAADSPVPQNME